MPKNADPKSWVGIMAMVYIENSPLKGQLASPQMELDENDIPGSIRKAFSDIAELVVNTYQMLGNRDVKDIPDAIAIDMVDGSGVEIHTRTEELPLFPGKKGTA